MFKLGLKRENTSKTWLKNDEKSSQLLDPVQISQHAEQTHTHTNKHIKHFTNSKVSVIAELALHMSQRSQKGDRHGWKELQKLDQFQVGRVILGSDGTHGRISK